MMENVSVIDLGGFDLDEALATVSGDSRVVIAAASKSFVSKLPAAEAEDVKEEDVCSVCMEGFQGGGNKRVPCGHVYHSECIILWLSRSNSSCPLCRRHIFLTQQIVEIHSSDDTKLLPSIIRSP
ncbi:hypothetical protein PIB30_009060 [Stylosanthes scabra]|uniref:RING-type domain-containing protein n=1 Tax=Stylosanthes scabra TaxID=79078 RepID=A0ABU6V751_9FABA|nr:hypothetical protein [Stylosanthes scabra]